MIDFARGHPNSSLLPSQETQCVLAALCQTMAGSKRVGDSALQYGSDDGNPDFLHELNAFIKRQSKDDDFGTLQTKRDQTKQEERSQLDASSRNRIFVTSGVSHGIELLCATQTRSGDVVLIERPTYFLVGGIFQSHNLVVRGLPMHSSSAGGVDVDKLVNLVESGEMNAPRMIYIIPTHQNPTGHTMPIDDRIKLTSFALRNEILVVSDEVYHLLDWRQLSSDGPRPARMASLSELKFEDGQDYSPIGGCVSVSSFTKIFAPGVRVGWIEGAPSVINTLCNYGYVQSQGGCAPFMGEIMRIALASGVVDDVLQNLRTRYKCRVETLCRALSTDTQIQIVNRPIGGYFMWIKFGNNINAKEFLEFCAGRVKFMPGRCCDILAESSGTEQETVEHGFSSHARLCFADLDVPVLERGIAELIECFRQYIGSAPNRGD